ncbi:PD-(D/E)XK nuclease family protein [Nitrosopumilus sp.]|uniref:PD-(D/E)XK nuclease family protein n=1 Tax=Nitrosopumilus sp. TaxID=2024843 RepID=UPI0029309A2E|nr:PD-(D/E)XK nuclease family protein [Nitrosopumilus sp.]
MTVHRKDFSWKETLIPESKRAVLIEKNNKHFYKTPEGHTYPSATTMLSQTMPAEKKNSLIEWREREGEEIADKVTKRATDIGTFVHKLSEDYLNNNLSDDYYNDIKNNNNDDFNSEYSQTIQNHFKQLQPLLNRIDNICETEIPLYHDYLMFGGTSDCIAEYDGTLSIIDFKTSRAEKYEEWIGDYFLQTTLYSIMYHNQTGLKIPQIVILISGEDGTSREFVKTIDDYVDLLFQRISEFNILEARD